MLGFKLRGEGGKFAPTPDIPKGEDEGDEKWREIEEFPDESPNPEEVLLAKESGVEEDDHFDMTVSREDMQKSIDPKRYWAETKEFSDSANDFEKKGKEHEREVVAQEVDEKYIGKDKVEMQGKRNYKLHRKSHRSGQEPIHPRGTGETIKFMKSKEQIGKRGEWEKALEKYKVGDVVDGRILALTNSEAIVKFDDGQEGQIPVSEITNEKIARPVDVLMIGDKIKAKIIKLDRGEVHLSMKRMVGNSREEQEAA